MGNFPGRSEFLRKTLYEQAVDIGEAVLGQEYPNTKVFQHNLRLPREKGGIENVELRKGRSQLLRKNFGHLLDLLHPNLELPIDLRSFFHRLPQHRPIALPLH